MIGVGYLRIAGAVAVALALAGTHRWAYNEGAEGVKARWMAEKNVQQQQAIENTERERQREDERREIARKAGEDAQKQIDAAQGDAATARAAGERLRLALSISRAAACAPRNDPAAPAASAPAEASERVFADVQRRLDEAQDRIAEFATEAHIAGNACTGFADSLSAEKP